MLIDRLIKLNHFKSLNPITGTVINQLIWSNLSKLASPKLRFQTYVGLSSFAYYYQLVIVVRFSLPQIDQVKQVPMKHHKHVFVHFAMFVWAPLDQSLLNSIFFNSIITNRPHCKIRIGGQMFSADKKIDKFELNTIDDEIQHNLSETTIWPPHFVNDLSIWYSVWKFSLNNFQRKFYKNRMKANIYGKFVGGICFGIISFQMKNNEIDNFNCIFQELKL